MADLSCQELVELVTDYLEGALPREDLARFEAHLRLPRLRDLPLQLGATIALARASGDQVEPSELSPLLDAFRDWHRSRA